ncbi:hypothetical protein [Hymenobacter pini]|uniref:hypothetical protein n=1 Tax=Hymenobacter pini TaxID=2880879 RepID=UPI001CF39F09|nr:hypothetical protein [Hymenobacter pini]MCA8830313.1 hypothetical protein [Hymenobacter pini]
MTQEDIEKSLLDEFKRLKSKPNHPVTYRWIQYNYMPTLNPKQQELVEPAIASLIEQGLVTEDNRMGGKCIVLTEAGYEKIFPLDNEVSIKRVKQLILEGFAKQRSKAGHGLDQRWLNFVLGPMLSPREVDVFEEAVQSLIEDGLIEEGTSHMNVMTLTEKGFDTIYEA